MEEEKETVPIFFSKVCMNIALILQKMNRPEEAV
jgi:hypothetical protein